MIIQGKVIEVEFDVEVPKNGGGTYLGTTLTYKDSQGKVNNKSWVKKVLDHPANGHVKAALQTLNAGAFFEAEAVKNDAGFWNWTQLKIVDGTRQVPTSTPQATTRSTFETPEERAERRSLDKEKFAFEKEKQKLIIRQSSLSNSINFSVAGASVEDVIAVAKEFEAYVLSND